MLRKIIFSLLFLGASFSLALAQKSKEDTVYTFPFHLESRLLVFEGELNGQPTNFVFDTGASLGLAGEEFVESGRIKAKKRVQTIRDSNNNTKRVGTGTSKQMKIGGMKVSNPQALITEMPFLSCQDYYLLGSNVIRLLNWKIDFDKMEVSVSLKPFPIESDFMAMKVFYENERPFTEMSFGGMKLSKVLIDTGYTRILDIDNSSDLMQNYLSMMESNGLTNKNISLSTGAISQSLDETTQIVVDTLTVQGHNFYDIPTDFFPTKSTKLGLSFFKVLSHTTIINNTDGTYYLDLREEPKFKDPMLLNLRYDEGKVLVGGKSLENDPQFDGVEIGDVITAINGESVSTFTSECDFVTWYFTYHEEDITLQFEDGTSKTFGYTVLKK